MSVIRQLSLFGADGASPRPDDLGGVLLAGGSLAVREEACQLEIAVDHPWRAAGLVAECARRGIAATSLATPAARIVVRTAFSAQLTSLAEGWLRGGTIRVPVDFRLDGAVLRLWTMAAGYAGPQTSYIYPVRITDAGDREIVSAALASAGVGAQLAVARGTTELSYRIVGKRRLLRVIELVGDPPKQATAGSWPS